MGGIYNFGKNETTTFLLQATLVVQLTNTLYCAGQQQSTQHR